jgi:hypothetical protein
VVTVASSASDVQKEIELGRGSDVVERLHGRV